MKTLNKKPNAIVAYSIVSESELYAIFNSTYTDENLPERLYLLGMDITKPYELQQGLTHRNRMNQVVKCNRWLGTERLDIEWLTSGYASAAAKDKAFAGKIVEDLYRSKGLTEDAQKAMEDRDKYDDLEN